MIDPLMTAATSEDPLSELECTPEGRLALLTRVEAAARELEFCAIEACKMKRVGSHGISQFRGLIAQIKESITARIA